MAREMREQILWRRRIDCMEFLNRTPHSLQGTYCPGVFDKWSCWPDTPSNTTAEIECPTFVDGFDAKRTAERFCDENGNWFRHPVTNRSWSNYSNCVDHDRLDWNRLMISMYEIGYTISLVALIVSLVVLIHFRILRCPRITIHINLFVSFALNNTLWLAWYRLVIRDVKVIHSNKIWCQALHVILHYFLLSNYTWMLCEGVYLHTVIISAFISEARLLKWMYMIGWGAPAITIAIYVTARGLDRDECQQCWMNDSVYRTIFIVPGCIAICLNVIFLCNIVRVLIVKLRRGIHVVNDSRLMSKTFIQALRATLLLVPLLGLHFLLTPFRPPENHPMEKIYEVISVLTSTLQGFCVAFLFCFFNGEIISQVKRKWRAVKLRRRANSCTVTSMSMRSSRIRQSITDTSRV